MLPLSFLADSFVPVINSQLHPWIAKMEAENDGKIMTTFLIQATVFGFVVEIPPCPIPWKINYHHCIFVVGTFFGRDLVEFTTSGTMNHPFQPAMRSWVSRFPEHIYKYMHMHITLDYDRRANSHDVVYQSPRIIVALRPWVTLEASSGVLPCSVQQLDLWVPSWQPAAPARLLRLLLLIDYSLAI